MTITRTMRNILDKHTTECGVIPESATHFEYLPISKKCSFSLVIDDGLWFMWDGIEKKWAQITNMTFTDYRSMKRYVFTIDGTPITQYTVEWLMHKEEENRNNIIEGIMEKISRKDIPAQADYVVFDDENNVIHYFLVSEGGKPLIYNVQGRWIPYPFSKESMMGVDWSVYRIKRNNKGRLCGLIPCNECAKAEAEYMTHPYGD